MSIKNKYFKTTNCLGVYVVQSFVTLINRHMNVVDFANTYI